ncbi:hypothetical protein HDU76_009337, partial [Blyttiomyces sp. JEL0837]
NLFPTLTNLTNWSNHISNASISYRKLANQLRRDEVEKFKVWSEVLKGRVGLASGVVSGGGTGGHSSNRMNRKSGSSGGNLRHNGLVIRKRVSVVGNGDNGPVTTNGNGGAQYHNVATPANVMGLMKIHSTGSSLIEGQMLVNEGTYYDRMKLGQRVLVSNDCICGCYDNGGVSRGTDMTRFRVIQM